MKFNIKNLLYILLIISMLVLLLSLLYFNLISSTDTNLTILDKVYTIKLSIYTSMVSIIGIILGYSLSSILRAKTEQLCNAYQKKHEDIKLEKDTDTAKIATLEAKIKTLEVALAKALGK